MSVSDTIVVSPVWPGDDQGYRIAVKSSLYYYRQYFERIFFVALSDQTKPDDLSDCSGISWTHIPVVRHPKWIRFLRSLPDSRPGIVMQFTGSTVGALLAERLKEIDRQSNPACVIIEDVPAASVLPIVRTAVPGTPVAIRTHNVHAEAFDGFVVEGDFLSRQAWKLEVRKVAAFERRILGSADRIWTISERDALETTRRFGTNVHGVVGIRMDHSRYREVRSKSSANVVSIGTADLRKAHGVSQFVSQTWPLVRAGNYRARLLLGGRGTEVFTDSESRIEGRGFILDDRTLLGEGQIFINPQERGSGVKLKSIVAMLAGKTLVSTGKGVEGVAGRDGQHFFVAENGSRMADIVLRLIEDPELSSRVGRQARDLATVEYGHGHSGTVEALLDDLVRERAGLPA